MTEFLTENARRAYPLEHEWPTDLRERWTGVLVDACVYASSEFGESRLSLLSVARTGSVLTFNVGIPGTYGVPVTFDRAAWTGGRTAVAYTAGTAEPRPFRTKLDFIESDGTQYVDTGVIFNFAEDLVLSGTVVSLSDNRSVIVGNYGYGRAAINVEFGGTSNNRPRQLRLYTTKQGSPVAERWLGARPPNTLIDFTCTYTAQDATAYVTDGVASATFPTASDTVTPTTQTLLAFLDGRSNKSQIANGIRMYALGIRQGGVLVRNYIPVLTWDGDVKMFDLASQSYPAHYGTFTGGTTVEAASMPAEPPNPFRAKVFLVLNVEAIDALLATEAAGGEVGIPFATRCTGGAIRMVTAITAQGPAVCEKPLYSLSDPNKTELSFNAGEHAVLKADDGVDLDVTRMAPVVGDMLRISAIAAPTAVDIEEEPIDMVIRGDECFTIDAEPGVRAAANGAIVTTGVVRIGNTCKPCCQCEDYKEAVELLKPAEEATWGLNGLLDAVKTKYDAALQAFNAAKARILAQVNSPDNVRITLAAAPSCNIYSGSNASGSRQRVTVTFLAENMTMVNATVSGTSISVAGFSVCSTSGQLNGTMPPGGTLMAAVTYAKPNTTSNAVPAMPSISGTCTVRVGSQTAARSLSAS